MPLRRFIPLVPRFIPLAALACLLGAGCSTIDTHERVAGWPQLKLVEHYVPDDVMRARCSKYVSFGFLPEACSEFYFDSGECHVWYNADYRPPQFVIEHERLHCQGYDHPGESTLRDILARYEARQRNAGVGASAARSAKAPPG
jgi:hypothetical protein